MAELAVATEIIQVTGAGVTKTKALHNLDANTSSAGEQTDFVGRILPFIAVSQKRWASG